MLEGERAENMDASSNTITFEGGKARVLRDSQGRLAGVLPERDDSLEPFTKAANGAGESIMARLEEFISEHRETRKDRQPS